MQKTFSRKFNAERHNKIVHDEMAMVYDKETDWKSSIKNMRIVSTNTIEPAARTKFTESPFIYTPSKIESIEDIRNSNLNQPYYKNNLKDVYKSDLDPDIIENEYDQIVFKIIGKIFPLIESLDSLLLSRHLDNKDRTGILSFVLITSLSSSNPVAFIKDKINYYRSIIAMERAIALTAYYFNIEPKNAREKLKGLVITAPYFKNKFTNKK